MKNTIKMVFLTLTLFVTSVAQGEEVEEVVVIGEALDYDDFSLRITLDNINLVNDVFRRIHRVEREAPEDGAVDADCTYAGTRPCRLQGRDVEWFTARIDYFIRRNKGGRYDHTIQRLQDQRRFLWNLNRRFGHYK